MKRSETAFGFGSAWVRGYAAEKSTEPKEFRPRKPPRKESEVLKVREGCGSEPSYKVARLIELQRNALFLRPI